MEKKFSKPVLGTYHHLKTESGENEAESKPQPYQIKNEAERVLLVDKPYQIKKKLKPVEKIKVSKRGLGVAKLEILRLEGKLQQMTEQLEQLQAEKENAAAAAVPFTHLIHRPPQHQHQHHHQFQVPFPPFVDPRQQYPNGMIPVPYGRFVPVGNFPAAAGAMNKDGPHPPPMNFVFQPMNQNGGYPGEPMNVIPTGNGGGFIPAGHPHEPITNMNGNGETSPAGHPHEPITNINRNGGVSPAGHQQHHEPNNNINRNGGVSPAGHQQHHEPNNNIMNANGGLPGGGEVNNGGFSNQNIAAAGNPYMFLDQQLRVQHLKLMHSARELAAIQRLQYRPPRPSNFSVQMNPVINIEEPKSKDKMVMNDSAGFLELSLGSTTNIDEKIKKEIDDEEVMEVDAFGARRRRSTSSNAVMEYEFFPAESSDNRSSSYSGGGGGGMGGSSEASTSDENTHLVDLSLKLSL